MVNLFFFAFLLLCSFQRSIMVGLTRLELVTSRLSGVRSNQLSYRPIYGGDEEIRTPDPLLARQVLSQLSYTPMDAGLSFRTSLPVFSFVCSLSGLGLSEPFPISLRLWMNFTCFSLLGVGLSGLEPPTSRLSGVRSNQLSYKPIGIRQPPAFPCRLQHSIIGRISLNHRVRDGYGCFP